MLRKGCSRWCRGNHNVRLGAMQQDTARLSGLVCSFASRTPLLSDTCPPRASESIKRFRYSSFSPTEAAIQIIVSMWSPPPKSSVGEGSLFYFVFVNGRSPGYYRTAGSPAGLRSAGLWSETSRLSNAERWLLRVSLLSPSPCFFPKYLSSPRRRDTYQQILTVVLLQYVPNTWNDDAHSGASNCCVALSHRFRMDAPIDKY